MDLKTTYLGLELKNPIISGSCPLGANLDTIRHLEDAGAAAIVMPSLFEEEIMGAARAQMEMESAGAGFAEASSYLPDPDGYHVGPDQYLEHLRAAKEAVSIPIIASLNGTSPGGWTGYAKKMEEAGADAIELNAYYLATDAAETGADVEQRTIDIYYEIRAVQHDLLTGQIDTDVGGHVGSLLPTFVSISLCLTDLRTQSLYQELSQFRAKITLVHRFP